MKTVLNSNDPQLTQREKEILTYVAADMSSKQIADQNQDHVFISDLNADFVTEEIMRQPATSTCPDLCTQDILGPGTVTTGDNNINYPFDYAVPSGSTAHWGASSNFTIVSSDNAHAVFNCTGTNPNSYIEAWIDHPCAADGYCQENINVLPHKPSGIENISDADVSIYPNSSSTEWHISFSNTAFSGCSLKLYNIMGEEVWISTNYAKTITINNGSLPQGIYLLKIKYQNYERSYKLIKY